MHSALTHTHFGWNSHTPYTRWCTIKHIQEQTNILTHRKVGGPDLCVNMDRALEVLIKVGLEGRLEGREGGLFKEGK